MSTSETLRCLPYFTRGEVVTGFGRGSKQLGIPTGETDFDHLQGFPLSLIHHLFYMPHS